MKEKNIQVTEQILVENYSRYYRLAYSYTKTQEDALDVVQESAYKAIRDCSKVENLDYISTWIYRIVVNTSLDLLRKRQKTSDIVGEAQLEGSYEDSYSDPDLEAALDHLEEKEKTIIILRYFEDLKLEDIAQITDSNLNTVKARLYRGLKKLKDFMTGEQLSARKEKI